MLFFLVLYTFLITFLSFALLTRDFISAEGRYSQVGDIFSLRRDGFYDSYRFIDYANNLLYADNSLYTFRFCCLA